MLLPKRTLCEPFLRLKLSVSSEQPQPWLPPYFCACSYSSQSLTRPAYGPVTCTVILVIRCIVAECCPINLIQDARIINPGMYPPSFHSNSSDVSRLGPYVISVPGLTNRRPYSLPGRLLPARRASAAVLTHCASHPVVTVTRWRTPT